MAEPSDLGNLPRATVEPPKRTRISVIWIIPILAALVAIGIAVQRIRSEGPTITIAFAAAEGIEAGKTFIKYKDVNIGRVTKVELSDDYVLVLVTAKIAKHAAGLMVQDAKFWVVRPTISLSGVSGLSTLLSGNYIGFEPGKSQESEVTFVGLDEAPVAAGQQGRQFVLNASDLGSLEVGSPIYYRRLQVGQVAGYNLTPDGKAVQVKIFINAPYDKYVLPGTRFWVASGIDVSLNADGVNVHTESLVALLVGGLAFDLPPFEPSGQPAAANTVFTLYGDRAIAMKAPDAIMRQFVLHFNEPLRGLSVGAPVTLLGLPAGEVTSVGLELDEAKANIRPQVLVTLYPERLLADSEVKSGKPADIRDARKREAFLRRLIEERGLRGQLKSGSLLTGQLYVAFDYYPKAPKVKLDLSQKVPELPVVPSTLVELEAKLGGILDKVDKMPLDAIGNDLKKDLESLDETLASAKKLMNDADAQLVPQFKKALEDLHGTLVAVEKAMTSANVSLLNSDAPAQQDLRDALQEFARAARALRVLADQLERQPSSVIRGKTESMSGGK
ncbi:MAG TPA: MlaD family protein [Casimicrobiaceae bacterium]|nr:MlaD family protein [Casimicrobiaceae bacterium]